MEQYKMPIVIGDKRIYLVNCSFCTHVLLPDGYHCGLGLEPGEQCCRYETVENITARIDEIFEKLPDGAGADFGNPAGTEKQPETHAGGKGMKQGKKVEHRHLGANLDELIMLELWPGWSGSVCGQIVDSLGRPAASFRDAAELLVILNNERWARNHRRRPDIPQPSGSPVRAVVTILYRRHGSIQGILKTADAEVPFRSGMELLYLLHEAAGKKPEVLRRYENKKAEGAAGLQPERGYSPGTGAVTG